MRILFREEKQMAKAIENRPKANILMSSMRERIKEVLYNAK